MRKLTLDDVLFDVALRPLMVETNQREGQTSLFPALAEVPRYKAVVDMELGKVLCVVTENYRLITNKEAIEFGKEYFKKVFSQTTADGMKVFQVRSPRTRSFCHIDFIHKSGGFEPWENERWVPFLRVTNSYNRTKLLRFDFGFCRWICENGLIFGKRGVTVRFHHTRDGMSRVKEIDIADGELKRLEVEFIERLNNLQRFHMPRKEMLPLSCKVFDLRVHDGIVKQPRRLEQLLEFRASIAQLTDKYFGELGENAYAALNVMTDFASRPQSYISPVSVVDTLQKRAGDWIDEFIPQIKRDDFSFDGYLREVRASSAVLSNLN